MLLILWFAVGAPLTAFHLQENARASGWALLAFHLAASLVLGSVLALAGVLLGILTPLYLYGSFGILSLVGSVLVKRAGRQAHIHWDVRLPVALAMLGIFLCAGALYLHAHEGLSGQRDSGVNVATAQYIRDHGTARIHDEFVDDLPSELRGALVRSALYPGFFVVDPDEGQVRAATLVLYPALLSVALHVEPLPGGLFFNQALAFVAVVLAFHVGERLLGSAGGVVAAALAALNPAQVYFARYPAPEMLSQSLVWAFLLGGVLVVRLRSVSSALLAVTAATMLFLTRVDAFLLLPAALFLGAVAAYYLSVRKSRFAIPAAAMAGAAVILVYYLTDAAVYIRTQIAAVEQVGEAPPSAGVFSALSAAGIALAGLLAVAPFSRWPRLSAWLPLAARVGAWSAFSFALLLPLLLLAWQGEAPYPHPGRRFPHISLLAAHLGWHVLALAMVGIALLGQRKSDAAWWFVALAAAPAFVYYLPHLHNAPVYPWGLRRYVPIVLPGIALLAALAIARLQRVGTLRPLAPVLVIAVVVFPLVQSAPLAEPEFAGFTQQVRDVGARFGEHDVILVDRLHRESSFFTPLRFVEGKTVLWMPTVEPDANLTRAALRHWSEEGRDVYFITSSSGRLSTFQQIVGDGAGFRPTPPIVMQVSAVPWLYGEPSLAPQNLTQSYLVYQIVARE